MAQLRHLDAEAAEEQLRELALVGQQAVATLASQARALRAWLRLGLGLALTLSLSLSLSLSLRLSPPHLPTHIATNPPGHSHERVLSLHRSTPLLTLPATHTLYTLYTHSTIHARRATCRSACLSPSRPRCARPPRPPRRHRQPLRRSRARHRTS